eukprot:jgi/Mesvir1/17161/Mv07586-RA.1
MPNNKTRRQKGQWGRRSLELAAAWRGDDGSSSDEEPARMGRPPGSTKNKGGRPRSAERTSSVWRPSSVTAARGGEATAGAHGQEGRRWRAASAGGDATTHDTFKESAERIPAVAQEGAERR